MAKTKAAEERPQYQITGKHGFFDGTRLIRRTKRNPGIITTDAVPSVTWIPLNEPARIASEKRKAEVAAIKADQALNAKMKDPAELLRMLVEKGNSPGDAMRELAAQEELRRKAAELAEKDVELEELRRKLAKAEAASAPLPPPPSAPSPPGQVDEPAVVAEPASAPKEQGVKGGSTSAAPRR